MEVDNANSQSVAINRMIKSALRRLVFLQVRPTQVSTPEARRRRNAMNAKNVKVNELRAYAMNGLKRIARVIAKIPIALRKVSTEMVMRSARAAL